MPLHWVPNLNNERIHKKRTVSTNEDIRLLAINGADEGTVVTADEQTGGKGRRGRSWQTEPETALLFSLLLRPHMTTDEAPQLTLLMAMAVTKAVYRITGLEAFIKWPNDVVVHSRKICGILTEMQLKEREIDFVVIGTGVNVNQTRIPEELRKSATSLRLERAEEEKISREELLDAILDCFADYYAVFCKTKDMSFLRTEYNNRLVSLDKEVRVLDPQGEFTGISKGINEKGELLVALPDGEVRAVYAGEVSVRGLYGYV